MSKIIQLSFDDLAERFAKQEQAKRKIKGDEPWLKRNPKFSAEHFGLLPSYVDRPTEEAALKNITFQRRLILHILRQGGGSPVYIPDDHMRVLQLERYYFSVTHHGTSSVSFIVFNMRNEGVPGEYSTQRVQGILSRVNQIVLLRDALGMDIDVPDLTRKQLREIRWPGAVPKQARRAG